MRTAKRGRPATDGATAVRERINIALTTEHKQRLEAMAGGSASSWVRRMIDQAWAQHHNKTKASQ